jgi:hypothetical protein
MDDAAGDDQLYRLRCGYMHDGVFAAAVDSRGAAALVSGANGCRHRQQRFRRSLRWTATTTCVCGTYRAAGFCSVSPSNFGEAQLPSTVLTVKDCDLFRADDILARHKGWKAKKTLSDGILARYNCAVGAAQVLERSFS